MRLTLPLPLRTTLLAATLGSASVFAPGAQAANPQAQSQYQQDVARCHNTPGIDVQACLQEAGAAAQAAGKDALSQPAPHTATQNRSQRCDSLPADQRQDCMTLMKDSNARVQGSVQSGGMLRETTIPIPAPASPATPVVPMTPAPAR